MSWTIFLPFQKGNTKNNEWLAPFVPGNKYQFKVIHDQDNSINLGWHNRASRNTSGQKWLSHWNQIQQSWDLTQDGVITVFPQLAALAGIRQRLSKKHIPVVAWCFNMGYCYGGLKGKIARFACKEIDRFVVHSRREINQYSQWLQLPEDRFEFVPLQRAEIPIQYQEETENPFILSMGSAHRDYQTLFEAVKKLNLRTIVVVNKRCLEGLEIPKQVEVLSGLTYEECHRLAQMARINVIPLYDHETAAGQVTIVEAMRMGRPVIATKCMGSEDYLQHQKTGMLVKADSVDSLTENIETLWYDQSMRDRFAKESYQYASQFFSDEAAGLSLKNVLDKILI